MNVHVLGSGRDVGRSCLLLSFAGRNVLFDCGAHPGFADKRRFPDFSSVDPTILQNLDAILISHFHFDHAAALPLLTEKLNCNAPIYMTDPSRELCRLMLLDFCSTSSSRGQMCPFTVHDVETCLSKVVSVRIGRTALIGRHADIELSAYYAGHVLGAVMFRVAMCGRSVVFSGDYATKSDRHLRCADVPFGLNPDLFITESTYCSTIRTEGRAEQEDTMMKAITNAVANNAKILVPISAFGRVQEVCSIMSVHADRDLLVNVPMYFVTGLASKANSIYETFKEWTSAALANTTGGDHICDDGKYDFLSRLKPFNRNEDWYLVQQRGPMILFATPGNLSTGLSLDVFKVWANDPNNVVIVPGFCFANSLASKLLSGRSVEGHSELAAVQCQLVNMAFSSHADARGIVRTCRKVNAGTVMLVHGEEQKMLEFQKHLSKVLGVPCIAPKNGQVVSIPLREKYEQSCSMERHVPDGMVSRQWQETIQMYKDHQRKLKGEAG